MDLRVNRHDIFAAMIEIFFGFYQLCFNGSAEISNQWRNRVMKKIMILIVMIIPFVIMSCQKNTKDEKKDTPLFKINGDVMETYYPDGTLQGRGGFRADIKGGKPVNQKNGEWVFYKADGKTVDAELSGYYMMDRLNKKLQMR